MLSASGFSIISISQIKTVLVDRNYTSKKRRAEEVEETSEDDSRSGASTKKLVPYPPLLKPYVDIISESRAFFQVLLFSSYKFSSVDVMGHWILLY